ncbi:hypothetical protein [Fusobacterium varium]
MSYFDIVKDKEVRITLTSGACFTHCTIIEEIDDTFLKVMIDKGFMLINKNKIESIEFHEFINEGKEALSRFRL